MNSEKKLLNSLNDYAYINDYSQIKEKVLKEISNFSSTDDKISSKPNNFIPNTTNSKIRKQIQNHKELIDKINKPSKNKSRKNFDITNEEDEIVKKTNEGKNLKDQVSTVRNVFFQMINKDFISLELDFEPNPSFLDMLNKFNVNYESETSLWISSSDHYENIIESIRILNKDNEKTSVFPISDIVFSVKNSTNFDIITFELDTELKYIYNMKKYTIDYRNDVSKKIEDLSIDKIKNLYPFQIEGIKYAIAKHGRLLLADEMGVGKTVQAVNIAGLYKEDWPVLIICPNAVKNCWRNEVLIWLKDRVSPEDIQILKSSRDKINKTAKFYILTYELALRTIDFIKKKKFNFIIADECHALKNQKSKRFEMIMPILKASKRLLLLSGTPILNKPIEAFHVVHAIRPDIFNNFNSYGERYCDPKPTRFGIDWSGVANTKELHYVLSTMMIRRLKKDVLRELPPKKRQKIEIDTDKEIVSKIKLYLQYKYSKDIESSKLENNPDDESFKKELEESRENKKNIINPEDMITFQDAYTYTGLAKLTGIKYYIRYLLDNDCKFIIFAYHLNVLDYIEEYLEEFAVEFIRIDGKVKDDEREKRVFQFQNNNNCRVAVLGITACATGITLSKASTVLFAELYWTPALMLQAEDRAHRIGQEHNCVNIHYLYGVDTIDEIIFPRLRDKYFVVSTTLDDKKMELNLQKLEVGIVGDFATDKDKLDKLEIETNEIEKINENDYCLLNLHSENLKRKNDLETETQTSEDFIEKISKKEISSISNQTRKYFSH